MKILYLIIACIVIDSVLTSCSNYRALQERRRLQREKEAAAREKQREKQLQRYEKNREKQLKQYTDYKLSLLELDNIETSIAALQERYKQIEQQKAGGTISAKQAAQLDNKLVSIDSKIQSLDYKKAKLYYKTIGRGK